jgi:lipopolysaccharide export system permease protein
MPILWRYLISYFLKVTLTCVVAFVAILLTMRLDEIAHFAGLGAPLDVIFLFALYQIPYILPLAIPLSCLIASFLVIQRLSHTHELIALRACGFSLKDILTPLLLTAAFLSLVNFWFISEVATQSHLKTNLLKNELRSINPLLLLHNKHLMRLKGFYFDSFGDSYIGESSNDVILAIPNKHQRRINLLIAKQFKVDPLSFIGEEVTLLTGKASHQEQAFDDLLVENMKKAVSDIQDFADLLQKKIWTINSDYLQFSLLLKRIENQQQLIQKSEMQGMKKQEIKSLRMHLNRSVSEIVKRFAIGLAAISFTLMGASFGLSISRQQNKRPLIYLIVLTIFYLVTFFAAKGLDSYFIWATSLYLIPHLVIIGFSLVALNRIAKGNESC